MADAKYRFGPLVCLWSMRFEGKHKVLKSFARTTSFKNILKTLSEHHQRLAAYNLCSGACTSLRINTSSGMFFHCQHAYIRSCVHFLPEVSDIEDASYLDYYSTLASCFPGITELELKRLETL